MDYTVLVKARITSDNRSDIKRFTEELENGTYEYSETFNSWTSAFRRGKGRYHWDSIRTGKRGAAVRTDGMDVRERRGKHSGNSEENSGNREPEVTPKYEQVALEIRKLEKQLKRKDLSPAKKREINKKIRELQKEFDGLFNNPYGKESYTKSESKQYSLKTDDGLITNKNGEAVAQIHENGSDQFSLKTYK